MRSPGATISSLRRRCRSSAASRSSSGAGRWMRPSRSPILTAIWTCWTRLTSLVDKSLVRLDESALEPRYGMLETMREFALEHLAASDEADRVRDAHAQYITHISQEFDQSMFTSQWREWQVRLSTEMLNLRAALTWLDRRGHTEALLILASGSWWALWQRGSHPGCARVVGAGPGCSWTGCARDPGLGAWGSRPICAWNQGDNESSGAGSAHAGVDLSLAEGFDVAAGMALYTLMLVGMEQGDLAQAVIHGEEAHRPFPPLWEQQVPVTSTCRCGVLHVDERRPRASRHTAGGRLCALSRTREYLGTRCRTERHGSRGRGSW